MTRTAAKLEIWTGMGGGQHGDPFAIADTAAQFRETGDCNAFEDQTMAFNDWIKLVDFADWSKLNEESSAAKALAS